MKKNGEKSILREFTNQPFKIPIALQLTGAAFNLRSLSLSRLDFLITILHVSVYYVPCRIEKKRTNHLTSIWDVCGKIAPFLPHEFGWGRIPHTARWYLLTIFAIDFFPRSPREQCELRNLFCKKAKKNVMKSCGNPGYKLSNGKKMHTTSASDRTRTRRGREEEKSRKKGVIFSF